MLASSITDLRIAGPFIALASVLAGSLGVPVPTFAALVFVGSLIAQRHGGVELGGMVFLAAMAGAVVGDVTWFFAGRRYGTSVLGLICRLSLSRDSCVRRTADTFARHGVKVLLLARFFPGLSVLSAPLAGASGVSLPKFISYAETGAAIWIGCALALGFFFSDQIGALILAFEHVGLGLGGAAIFLIGAYIGWSWFRRRQLLRRLRVARISADELAALMAEKPRAGDCRCAFQTRAKRRSLRDPRRARPARQKAGAGGRQRSDVQLGRRLLLLPQRDQRGSHRQADVELGIHRRSSPARWPRRVA